MTEPPPCTVAAGQTRILHGYPTTILTECRPTRHGWQSHGVRFDTLAYRDTCGPVETSAFCWEIGPAVASPILN